MIVDRLFHSVRSVVKKGSFKYDRLIRENTYSVSRMSIFVGGDCMKKIIAISVMFVLLTGAAFAADVSGSVIGTVNVLTGDNGDDSKVTSSAGLDRVRVEASGSSDSFGGWVRLDPASLEIKEDEGEVNFSSGVAGNVWWKPVDELKILIGGNPDGFWGKEGVSGWMFYQTAYDTGVTVDGANVWGGDNIYGQGLKYRNAFYRGFGDNGLLLEIRPADIATINIALPVFAGGETADVFKHLVAQVDLHLDFGNIAITYEGEGSYIQGGNTGWVGGDGATIFAYFGGSFGPLALDVGLGYELVGESKFKNPIAIGLGAKYATDSFGVKFRAVTSLAGDDKATKILTDVLPYFVLGDKLRAFVSFGLGMTMPEAGDSVMDWHFNPYVEVGEEWGAKFLAGIKVQSGGNGESIGWAVPIALSIGF